MEFEDNCGAVSVNKTAAAMVVDSHNESPRLNAENIVGNQNDRSVDTNNPSLH